MKALKIARGVAGIVNSEKHNLDTTITTNIDSTGLMTRLTDVAQGDDQTSRSGRSILVKSLQLRQRLAGNASAATTNVRQVLFIDLDPDGATPTATELLTSASTVGLRNILTDQNRFKVLWDSMTDLDTVGRQNKHYSKFFKLHHHVKYDGTNATDSSWGAIWLFQVSNQATNTAAQETAVRIRFYDN